MNWSNSIKYILLAFGLLIAGFNSYRFWQMQDRKVDLENQQITRETINDSLKNENKILLDRNQFLEFQVGNIQKQKQVIYKNYVEKSAEATKQPGLEQFEMLKELIAK